MNSAQAAHRGRGGKFLTFLLDQEEYGVEILKVREIIGLLPVTRVPRSPASVLGVVNLRGKVIPVLDLKAKLGMGETGRGGTACIVVVHAGGLDLGVVVDQVCDVADISEEAIVDAPQFGAGLRTEFLLGIARSGERVKLLLDLDEVLGSESFGPLEAVAQSAA